MMVKVTKRATIITKRNNKMRCFDDESANCVERYLADRRRGQEQRVFLFSQQTDRQQATGNSRVLTQLTPTVLVRQIDRSRVLALCTSILVIYIYLIHHTVLYHHSTTQVLGTRGRLDCNVCTSYPKPTGSPRQHAEQNSPEDMVSLLAAEGRTAICFLLQALYFWSL